MTGGRFSLCERVVTHALYHRLHDTVLCVETDSAAARWILASYLSYFEGPSLGPARHELRLVLEISDPLPAPHPVRDRRALTYEIGRDDRYLSLWARDRAAGLADVEAGEARVVVAPGSESDAELLRDLVTMAVAEMLRYRGWWPIHAAASVLDDCGILVIGSTGAGKSTLALGMAQAGFGILTDDWALLRENTEGISVGALVRTVSLPRDQVHPQDEYEVLEERRDEVLPKLVVTRESLAPPRLLEAPLRGVVLASRQASEVTEVAPARSVEVVARGLGQSALLTASRKGVADQARLLGRIAETTPAVIFRGGRDVGRNPHLGGVLLSRWIREL